MTLGLLAEFVIWAGVIVSGIVLLGVLAYSVLMSKWMGRWLDG